MSYGGLRLKSLVYHDGVSASGDTVLYRYPLPGIPMYPEITNVEVLQYSGFSDRLEHSRMKFKGLAFLNTGNNGLYYRQVEEIRPGRGKKSYAFHVPFCFLVPVYAQYYPFCWQVCRYPCRNTTRKDICCAPCIITMKRIFNVFFRF